MDRDRELCTKAAYRVVFPLNRADNEKTLNA